MKCFGSPSKPNTSLSSPLVRNGPHSPANINDQPSRQDPPTPPTKIKNNARMGIRGIDIETTGEKVDLVRCDPDIYGSFSVNCGPIRPLEPPTSGSSSRSPPQPQFQPPQNR